LGDSNCLVVAVEYLLLVLHPDVVQHRVASVAHVSPDQLQGSDLLAVFRQLPSDFARLREFDELRKILVGRLRDLNGRLRLLPLVGHGLKLDCSWTLIKSDHGLLADLSHWH